MDVSALRAEIKAWERKFKAKHGKPPSVQDIRDQPHIADKYKRYKKLAKNPKAIEPDNATQPSRSATPPQSDPTNAPPQTPPRNGPRNTPHISAPLLFASTSRIKATSEQLSGYNPFSPQKDRTRKPIAEPNLSPPKSPNPFASPVKGKGKATGKRSTRKRKPSLDTFSNEQDRDPFSDVRDPFSDIRDPFSDDHGQFSDDPELHSAVASSKPALTPLTRARKRLRGEPVTPSPDKRRRIELSAKSFPSASSGALSSFQRALMEGVDDDDENDEEYGIRKPTKDEDLRLRVAPSTSSMGETPMKQPNGFTLLFDEERGRDTIKGSGNGNGNIFARTSSKSNLSHNATQASYKHRRSKSPDRAGFLAARNGTSKKLVFPNGIAFRKSNLFAERDDLLPTEAAISLGKPAIVKARSKDEALNAKAYNKREDSPAARPRGKKRTVSSAAEVNDDDSAEPPKGHLARSRTPEDTRMQAISASALIPPSPLPESSRDGNKKRGYAANSRGRKKPRLGGNGKDANAGDKSDDDAASDDAPVVKMVAHRQVQRRGDSDDDVDPLVYAPQHEAPGDPREPPISDQPISHAKDADANASPAVDLPERLRSILALDSRAAPVPTDAEEEQTAAALVYGRRIGHYDGTRGGEIWDIGEVGGIKAGVPGHVLQDGILLDADANVVVDDRLAVTDGEDDWDAEPVPWEVGEL